MFITQIDAEPKKLKKGAPCAPFRLNTLSNNTLKGATCTKKHAP